MDTIKEIGRKAAVAATAHPQNELLLDAIADAVTRAVVEALRSDMGTHTIPLDADKGVKWAQAYLARQLAISPPSAEAVLLATDNYGHSRSMNKRLAIMGKPVPEGMTLNEASDLVPLAPTPPETDDAIICRCGTTMVCPDIGCDRHKSRHPEP